MRKPRPATFNPAQALHLIASDRTGSPLSCPSCSGQIERTPNDFPPPPRCQVTLRCRACGRLARYIAGAAWRECTWRQARGATGMHRSVPHCQPHVDRAGCNSSRV